MTMKFPRIAPSLLDEDDVLSVMAGWRRQGLRTALVTLVAVEGGAPRQAGSQMAVAEDGRYAGYLSGGCLEQAVALEAKAAITDRKNRLVRYGKGSPYFDIRLPCGSGMDLYFDQGLGDAQLQELLDCRAARTSCALTTGLNDGVSVVSKLEGLPPPSSSDGRHFTRVYTAPLRLALIGNGPALTGITALSRIAGLDLMIWSTDEETQAQVAACGAAAKSQEKDLDELIAALDDTSAAVLIFHDHQAEPEILRKLLQTPCFYLGVLGNRAVHRTRCAALIEAGVTQQQIDRLHAPVGAIPNAKSKTTFAFGVLTELLTVAKSKNLIA